MKKDIVKRLNRLNGQIAAVARMVEEEEHCEKVIIQFQASKSALEKAFLEYLDENLTRCIDSNDSAQIKKTLNLILKNK